MLTLKRFLVEETYSRRTLMQAICLAQSLNCSTVMLEMDNFLNVGAFLQERNCQRMGDPCSCIGFLSPKLALQTYTLTSLNLTSLPFTINIIENNLPVSELCIISRSVPGLWTSDRGHILQPEVYVEHLQFV